MCVFFFFVRVRCSVFVVSSLRDNYHRIHEIFSFKLTRDILIEAENRRKN